MDWGIGGLEDWRIGGLEDWRIGDWGLEDWRIGGLEDSRIGGLGDWRIRGLEDWGIGGLEDSRIGWCASPNHKSSNSPMAIGKPNSTQSEIENMLRTNSYSKPRKSEKARGHQC